MHTLKYKLKNILGHIGLNNELFPSLFILARTISLSRSGGSEEIFFYFLGALVLLFPRYLVVYFVCTIIDLLNKMPDMKDHNLVTLILSLGLMYEWIKSKKLLNTSNIYFLNCLCSTIYICAAFHKLNYNFFDSRTSCAPLVLNLYSTSFLKFNEVESLNQVVIYLTILAEGVVPLFLLFEKTRKYALGALFVFHLVLSLFFLRFSSTMMLLLFSFFPKEKILDKPNWIRPLSLALAVVLIITFTIYLALPDSNETPWYLLDIQYILWLVFQAFLSYILIFKTVKFEIQKFRLNFTHYFLLLVCFTFASMPYLGLKTQGSFSIYSNLETSSLNPNHIFGLSKLKIFRMQDELVQIENVQVDLRKIKLYEIREVLFWWRKVKPFQVSLFELRRMADKLNDQRMHSVFITYRIGDQAFGRSEIASDPMLINKNSPFLNKILTFIPINDKFQCGKLDF